MMTKNKFKTLYILLLFVFLVLVAPFILWFIIPSKALDIIVLNKTFPVETNTAGEIEKLDYSKQRGLYWLINHLDIHNPATKKAYTLNTDYYGNFLMDGQFANKPLEKLANVPDVIFLSDMYGTGKSKINGEEADGISGMTKDEISLVSTYYAKGTTVIGEYNIAGDPTATSVSKELEKIFGVNFTGVAGKFFSDLSSDLDVPNWIRNIYEHQYGKKWNIQGSGIVIAGNNNIVVLQRGIGFTGDSIQITMDEDYKRDYGTQTSDYYNWFEIVEPSEEATVMAWYKLNLTEKGESQLEPFGLSEQFPAIIAKQSNHQKSYYLAGDFTDYRGPEKISQFTGAATLYRYFSVKSEGDLSYFYWHFYVPLVSKILKDTKPLDQNAFKALTEVSSDGSQLVSKVVDKKLEVYQNGAWSPFYIQGVDIGSTIPSNSEGALPHDLDFYTNLFEQIATMNANTIRVYTLMPSDFYRALDNYNNMHPDKMLYLLQNISVDENPPSGNYFDDMYHSAFEQAIEDTINSIHGNAVIKKENGSGSDLYVNDVSSYVLGYLIDPKLSMDNVKATNKRSSASKFEGDYISAKENSAPTESWLASISNKTYQYEQTNYSMQHPAAIISIPELDALYQGMYSPAGQNDNISVDINQIVTTGKVTSGFFGAYSIFPDQPGLMQRDSSTAQLNFSEYKKFVNHLIMQSKYPVLISEFGIPTSGNITEDQQAEGIVSLLEIIKDSGAMGGLIYEWTDEWGANSSLTSSWMIPYSRGTLWHNTIDPAQNYGIVSVESPIPTDYSMNLRGSGPLREISLTADESYFYIRANMNTLPDFSKQKLMIYLDTIDRKNGELLLAPGVGENHFGVEFNIRIDDPKKADLLVIPSYNVSRGSYYSTVSMDGIFERIKRLSSPEYVTKSGLKIPAVYEDGSTLIPGSFENLNTNFYFDNNKLNVRIPWARLNFTDPSSLLVLNDEKNKGLHLGTKEALSVRLTDGIVTSLVIMDKETDKIDYQFPEKGTSTVFRTFGWSNWDVPKFVIRNKKSYDKIKEVFLNNTSGSNEGAQ